MASRHISNYIRKRFTAHRNLLKILGKQGVRVAPRNPADPNDIYITFDPQNEMEFRIAWHEKQNVENRNVIFERDNKTQTIEVVDAMNPNSKYYIIIVYIVPEAGSEVITHSMIDNYLKPKLLELGIAGESHVVNDSVQIILLTEVSLNGMARNQLTDFNMLLKRGVRHFTLEELQYDPTEHITQPKRIEKATEEEIRNYVEEQKGLLIGNQRLAENYDERMAAAETPEEAEKIEEDTDNEILGKLPTINSDDPLVKWYGFKIGDILKIYRRIGQTEFTYRRVIFNNTTI